MATEIVTPQLEELVPGAFCKVKQFQKCLCTVVAMGTEAEMTTKLEEMEMQEEIQRREEEETQPPPRKRQHQMQEEGDNQVAQPPPKKRSRKPPRPSKGKENKTPVRSAKKKPSSILVVGSKMSSEPLKELQPSAPILKEVPLASDTEPEPVKEVTFESSIPISRTPLALQRELSFSSFSTISNSPLSPAEISTNDGQELDKSGNGKYVGTYT